MTGQRPSAEDIKAAIDPRQFYGKWFELAREQQLNVRCRFHDDTTPSLSLNLDTGRFKCFNPDCRAAEGGSIIDFWMLERNVEFPDACTQLADQYGISANGTSREPKPPKNSSPKPIPDGEAKRLSEALLAPEHEAEHRRLMDRRGWSEETLKRWEIGWHPKRGYSIPVRDAAGACVNIKFYQPGVDQDGQKFTSWGKGYGSNRIFNPEALAQQDPIILCEGELDVITATQHGFENILSASLGAGNWDESFNATFQGKDVVIVYDIDDAGVKGAQKVAAQVSTTATSVKVVSLPLDIEQHPHGDLSDYLAGHTADNLAALISESPLYEPDRVEQVRQRRHLDEGFGTKNPFRAALFADDLRELGDWIAYPDERGMPAALYHYQNGVYRAKGVGTAHTLLKEILGELSTETRRNQVVSELALSEVVKDTSKVNLNRTSPSQPEFSAINIRNGWLEWKTGELHGHSPTILSTAQIPVRYDSSATCPKIDAFFKQVLPEDCIDLIYQVFGYMLLPTTDHQRAFMLTGEGSNGKSILLDLLRTFIGSENCASVALQELDRNRFAISNIVDKLVNLQADLDATALRSTGIFKQVVSGDRLTAERKHENAFQFTPFARLIYSANEIPKSADRTYAFYRRWVIIPFPNRFEGTDRREKSELLAEITTPDELSGLLNKAIEGLRVLAKNKGFVVPDSAQEAMDEYQEENEPVLAFLRENCVFDPNLEPGQHPTVGKTEVWGGYGEWCDAAHIKHRLTQTKFNKAMEAKGARESQGTGNDKSRGDGPLKGKRVWRGVRWRIPEDEDDTAIEEDDDDIPF